jgi:hypothetical protein
VARTSDHLLVYDGSSDPATPRLLGERPTTMAGQNFTGGCLRFDGRVVTMFSREYAPTDPGSSPTIGVKVLAMWPWRRSVSTLRRPGPVPVSADV